MHETPTDHEEGLLTDPPPAGAAPLDALPERWYLCTRCGAHFPPEELDEHYGARCLKGGRQ